MNNQPIILHIEDDSNIREIVRRVLQKQYQVEEASTGLEGIKKAQSLHPDLILMDLQLPSMSGYEATTRIRSFDELKPVPIVAVTGSNSSEEREKTLAAGCTGFIPKPIDLFELSSQIEEYLSGKVERTTDQVRSEYFRQYSEELVEKLQARIEEMTEANQEMQRLNLELIKRDQYLENMLDALWVVDPNEETVDMNPALLSMLRYPKEEMLSTPIFQFMDEVSRKKYFNMSVRYLQEGQPTQNELTFFDRDGNTVQALVSSQPLPTLRDGTSQGYFHVLHDVTERKKLESELRESEKKYRSLVNNSLIGIFRANQDGQFTTVNPRLVKILGYSKPEELYELPNIAALSHSKMQYKTIVELLKSQKLVSDYETVLKKRNGEEIIVLVNVQKVTSETTNETTYEGLIEDITEKRALETSLRQANRELEIKNQINKVILAETQLEAVLKHLIQNTFELMAFDAAAIYLPDKESRKLHYKVGKGFSDSWIQNNIAIPLNDDTHFIQKAFNSGDILTYNQNDDDINGRGFWLTLPISLHDEILGVMVCRREEPAELADQERRTLEALRNQIAIGINHVIQIENINASKLALEESYAELERLNQFKDQFLANMSHELRTPLNSIIGFSEVLIDGLAGDVNAEQQEFIGNILGSGQHLLSLINDILDMSKIRSGQMDLHHEPVDCRELITEVNQTVAGIVRGKNQQYEYEIRNGISTVWIDKKKIKQVLLNLLGNASKFTPENGEISLEVYPELSNEGAKVVRFEVHDSGIGIEQENQDLIFDEFRQVDGSHSREYEGTGLGLPIAKKLIELHGGTMGVESAVNAGSTFFFELPWKNGELHE